MKLFTFNNCIKYLFLPVIVVFSLNIHPLVAASITSAQSGNWNDPLTWSPNVVPDALDDVFVLNGHTVTNDFPSDFDLKASLTIHPGGILNFTDMPAKKISTLLGSTLRIEGEMNLGIGVELYIKENSTLFVVADAILNTQSLLSIDALGVIITEDNSTILINANVELHSNSRTEIFSKGFLNISGSIIQDEYASMNLRSGSNVNVGGDWIMSGESRADLLSGSNTNVDGDWIMSGDTRANLLSGSNTNVDGDWIMSGDTRSSIAGDTGFELQGNVNLNDRAVFGLGSGAFADIIGNFIINSLNSVVVGHGGISLGENPSSSNVIFNNASSSSNISSNITIYSGPGSSCNDTCSTCAVLLRGTGSSLPIELAHFTSKKETCSNRIQWTTETEVNNDYFELEKSVDGINFEVIERVAGAGTSINFNHYELIHNIDMEQYPVSKYYYRLKHVDLDGKSSYSYIIYSEVDCIFPEFNHNVTPLFPNPNKGGKVSFKIRSIDSGRTSGRIRIYNMQGILVLEEDVSGFQDQELITFDTQGFLSGIYHVKFISDSNWSSPTQKLIITD